MLTLVHLNSTTNKGHQLVQKLHQFYSNVHTFSLVFFIKIIVFILAMPFLLLCFLVLNSRLKKGMYKFPEIDFRNYVVLKMHLEKLNEHVKYFHTFFNADKKSLSWFIRPLFPLIKIHVHLQADYRDVLKEKITKLNTGVSGTRFVLLKESELWEYRNKSYSYLS